MCPINGVRKMYVISYDITSDRLRNKISKELENYGRRVQYSVFECRIEEKQFQRLYEKLLLLMDDESEGNIRIYKLCGKCNQEIQTIGIKNESMVLEEEDVLII